MAYICPIPQGYSGAIKKERGIEKLQAGMEFGNPRLLPPTDRKPGHPLFFLMVPGVGSPALTNQACKAWLENCKRVIAPATGAHHDHPGKVAGATRRDRSSRCGNSGIRLSWRQLEARRGFSVVGESGQAR